MNTDDIRKVVLPADRPERDFWLREIAAQLAELNQKAERLIETLPDG
jgi:hypothetical protein